MADRTDGALSATVDPAGSSGWDSVLSEGIASTGIDPNASFETAADPGAETPQSVASGSSAETETIGSSATPQAAATGDDGSEAIPAPVPETDPLANAEPFTYTVDGESKTIDGAFRLPGEGLYVPEDKVPQFQLLASRADTLDRQNRELYQRHASLEKLTEWKQGDTTLTGAPAVEAQRVFIAQSTETIKQLASALSPENFAKYVAIGQNPDGSFYVEPDKAALDALRERLQFVTDRAGFNTRKELAQLIAPQPSAPAPDAPIESVAPSTVDAFATQLNVALSADAKTFLVAQLPRYVRATTPEERGQFGARIVDASFADLIRREARTAATTAKVAETAQIANKFNTGMNTGRKPAVVPPQQSSAPVAQPKPEKVGKQAAWDNVLQSALSEISV